MLSSQEKVAYLKGLADGLELGKDSKQDKLIGAIIDVLDVIAEDLYILDRKTDDLIDEIDAVSDDLADVEDILYDAEEFYSEDDYDDECCCEHEHEHEDHECCSGHEHEHGDHECCGGHEHEHGDHECCCHGDGDLYSVICPNCENELTVDESIVKKGSFNCPKCNATLEFETYSDDESPDPE